MFLSCFIVLPWEQFASFQGMRIDLDDSFTFVSCFIEVFRGWKLIWTTVAFFRSFMANVVEHLAPS